jgi:alpha-ketoglutarate-dependent 2,4-dichlorophenoxyacetate dioxygenase
MLILPALEHGRDFIATVGDVDLSRELEEAQIGEIQAAIARFGVLIFRNQSIDDVAQARFAARFGDVEDATKQRSGTAAGIDAFTNVAADGSALSRVDPSHWRMWYNLLWHTDGSYKPTPIRYSFLAAKILPPKGGNTEFADLRTAFEALEEREQDELRMFTAEHSVRYTHDALGFEPNDATEQELIATGHFGTAVHPLVRRHTESGRETLYLSSHAHRIVGMCVVEGRMRLRDLKEHSTARRFVYSHVWQEGDLLMWDNKVTMHRARPYGDETRRSMHRTAVTRAEMWP